MIVDLCCNALIQWKTAHLVPALCWAQARNQKENLMQIRSCRDLLVAKGLTVISSTAFSSSHSVQPKRKLSNQRKPNRRI